MKRQPQQILLQRFEEKAALTPVDSCRSCGGQVTARRASVAGRHEIPLFGFFFFLLLQSVWAGPARRVKSAAEAAVKTRQCATVLG